MAGDSSRGWWEKRRDQHLVITRTITFGSLILLGWCLYFFLLQGNAVQSSGDQVDWPTALSWAALLFAIVGLFWAAPEFLFYQGHFKICQICLETTNSAELRTMRSDALESSKVLGKKMEERINSHLNEYIGNEKKKKRTRRS